MNPVDRYLELALAPDAEGLARMLEQSLAEDGPAATYDGLVQPALELLGVRWERDELTVADEHLVTALTEQLLPGRHRPRGGGPVVVVACTPGNEHRVGARLAADALARAGWRPLLLPEASPYAEIVLGLERHGARLLALSVGVDRELDALYDDLAWLRPAIGAQTPVLVGGGAVRRHAGWEPPPGVVACRSVSDALREGRRLLAQLPAEHAS